MRARAFTDEEDSPETGGSSGSGASEEPEYNFEGFNVEFSTKVMLTPIAASANGKVIP